MPQPNRFVTARLTFRKGTTQEWEEHDPVLLNSEPAWNTTLGALKIGNGVDKWSDIPYIANDGSDKATKVSLGNYINEAASLFSTKTSLGNTKNALEDLINLRATTVSLGNFKTSVEDTYATKVSLGAVKVSLGTLDTRVAYLEEHGSTGSGGSSSPMTGAVQWQNVSEINQTGEILKNPSFSNNLVSFGDVRKVTTEITAGSKTALVGDIGTIDRSREDNSANYRFTVTRYTAAPQITQFTSAEVGRKFRAIVTNNGRGYEAGQI